MKQVSCIVIEDEPYGMEIIVKYIRDVDGLKLLGTFSAAKEAIVFLQNNKVQLMFLDIHLPDISGLALFRSLNNPPKVIFTTAYHQYAVEGFELNAVDYLMKPIAFERFLKAVNRAFDVIYSKTSAWEDSKIVLRSGKKIYPFEKDQILYFEACGDYVKVKTKDGNRTIHGSLKELEQTLDSANFVRIHRSYIINMGKIELVNTKCVLIGGESIPVGLSYAGVLNEKL